jgi:membrane protein
MAQPPKQAERKPDAQRRPRRGLLELGSRDWKSVAAGAYSRFSEIELTDRAAALAYYGFLSLFPALIVAVALLALFGSYPETYDSIVETLREAAPGTAVDTLDSSLRDVLGSSGAGGLLGIGLVFSLITASGAVGAAIRALEAINESGGSESFIRGFVRGNLTRVWLTAALMGLMLAAFVPLIVAGPMFESIAEDAGVGDTGRAIVSSLRYPVGFAAVLAALLLLYSFGPAGSRRRLSEHLPGAVIAGVLWVIASVAFSFYVDRFGSFNATYGALGAVIILLIWIYVSAVAVLIGALANRELLRVRQVRVSP